MTLHWCFQPASLTPHPAPLQLEKKTQSYPIDLLLSLLLLSFSCLILFHIGTHADHITWVRHLVGKPMVANQKASDTTGSSPEQPLDQSYRNRCFRRWDQHSYQECRKSVLERKTRSWTRHNYNDWKLCPPILFTLKRRRTDGRNHIKRQVEYS